MIVFNILETSPPGFFSFLLGAITMTMFVILPLAYVIKTNSSVSQFRRSSTAFESTQ